MRVESPKAAANGGWIHRVNGEPMAATEPPKRIANVEDIAKKMFFDKLAGGKRAVLATKLGVSAAALVALRVGIGWDYDGSEFASFPSRDAACKVIGITRRYDDGAKKTMAGTRSGVFVPEDWWKHAGPVCIVEGASDVAALHTHGFAALGRPSNVAGADIISAYLFRRARGRQVLVIGENDRKPERVGGVASCPNDCRGCAWCWPGRYGAIKVATTLNARWAIPPHGHKDVRSWANASSDFRGEFTEWLKPARCW